MADSYSVIEDALQHAQDLLTGERARDYGDPVEAHEVIASFWSTYLGRPVSGQDVSLMLALMKIARLKASPHHQDSMVDGLAYLAIGNAHQAKAAKARPQAPSEDLLQEFELLEEDEALMEENSRWMKAQKARR